MGGLIQNEDIKTEGELTGAGGTKSQLPNDSKVYLSATGNWNGKTLKEALEQGLIGAPALGSSDTILNVSAADFIDLTGWDTGNGATPTPLSGGTFQGTFVLNGDSVQYTMVAASLNDFFWSPIQTVDDLISGLDANLAVFSNYTGDDDDIYAYLYDDTNDNIVNLKNPLKIAGGSENKIHQQVVSLLAGVTQARIGFHIKVANDTKVLKFDRFNLQSRPFVFDGIVDRQFQRFQATEGTDVALSSNYIHFTGTFDDEVNEGIVAHSIVSSNSRWTAQRDCVVHPSFDGDAGASATAVLFAVFNSSDTEIYRSAGTRQETATRLVGHGTTLYLKAGEYFKIFMLTIRAGVDYRFNVVAEADNESIVTPEKQDLVYSARIANGGTATITSEGPDDFIASVNRSALGTVDIVYKTNFFGIIPAVTADVEAAGNDRFCDVFATSLTGCTVKTGDQTGSDADLNFTLFAHRQKGDHDGTALVARPVERTAHIYYDTGSNTAEGGAMNSGVNTAVLNKVDGDTSIVKLSSNQIEFLVGGQYKVIGAVNGYEVNLFQAYGYNATATAVINELIGTSAVSGAGTAVQAASRYGGTIDVAAGTKIEIRVDAQTTKTGNGFGRGAYDAGVVSKYNLLSVTKIK